MQISPTDFQNKPHLTHLKRLTTKDGLIQHSDLEVPDPSYGYSIDDNARALIACLWHFQLYKDPSVLSLAEIYFDYLKKAEKEGGSFHNFLSFSEKILDAEGSEDSIGRAYWALGVTVALHPDENVRQEATAIMARTNISRHLDHIHLRAKAYILLGLAALDKKEEIEKWADCLAEAYQRERHPRWEWFEGMLCYANATLPFALMVAYEKTGKQIYLDVAEKTFTWLDNTSRANSHPAPIGQNGWYYRNREKALYDQQPLDASDMILAANKLFEITQDKKYSDLAIEWMNWYYGNNIQSKPLINEHTWGIYDALTPGGVNENQGAESIVTYLMAYLDLVRLYHPLNA